MIFPTFPKSVYAKRRKLLAKNLRPNTDLVIIFNRLPVIRNNDTEYRFRSDSNFVYWSGFYEEHSAFLLWKVKEKKGETLNFELFCQNRDPLKELWTGKLTGPERAASAFGADTAYPIEKLQERVLDFFKSIPKGVAPRIYCNSFDNVDAKFQLEEILKLLPANPREGKLPLEGIFNATQFSRKERLIKDTHEIGLMKKVSQINVKAHLSFLKQLKAGLTEKQTQAIIEKEFLIHGADGVSYGTICATGANATCLHYQPSFEKLKKGDLFLIDAGCELDHYASDITRTYPIGVKFSKAQKDIMKIVAEAHQAVTAIARVGTLYSQLQSTAIEVLVDGLCALKLLRGNKKDIIAKGKYKEFYPHSIGHWMGMDVHDPCPVFDENSNSIKLKPGMIFTVEPGIYIQAENKIVPPRYRGIGVRIEDDILVTEKEPIILTEGLPRYADEIEAVI